MPTLDEERWEVNTVKITSFQNLILSSFDLVLMHLLIIGCIHVLEFHNGANTTLWEISSFGGNSWNRRSTNVVQIVYCEGLGLQKAIL